MFSPDYLTAPRRRGRILLAEDDQEMRRILVETLRLDDHEVHHVGDGATLLLELAQNHRFNYDAVDVVVADVRMPSCSGLQAFETIRSVRPRLPFILLTAFGDPDMHARAASLGAVLLDKPLPMTRLRSVVAGTLARRRQ